MTLLGLSNIRTSKITQLPDQLRTDKIVRFAKPDQRVSERYGVGYSSNNCGGAARVRVLWVGRGRGQSTHQMAEGEAQKKKKRLRAHATFYGADASDTMGNLFFRGDTMGN